jgi:hypothetical protein
MQNSGPQIYESEDLPAVTCLGNFGQLHAPAPAFTLALVMKTSRVKLKEDVLHQWMIVQVQNENLACGSASRWIPVGADGLAQGDPKPLKFNTVEGAISYAGFQGFEIQRG